LSLLLVRKLKQYWLHESLTNRYIYRFDVTYTILWNEYQLIVKLKGDQHMTYLSSINWPILILVILILGAMIGFFIYFFWPINKSYENIY